MRIGGEISAVSKKMKEDDEEDDDQGLGGSQAGRLVPNVFALTE